MAYGDGVTLDDLISGNPNFFGASPIELPPPGPKYPTPGKFASPDLVAPPPEPGAAPAAQPSMAGAVSDIGASAATPSPLGPVLQRSRWALTQPPGNYQQAPNYGTAAANVAAGVPGTGKGLTKLGKVFAVLQSLGQGAMVGSTQPTFGTGALSANAFENQQIATGQEQQQRALGLEQGQLGLQQARENLAYMPLYRAMQMEQMRQMQAYRQSQEQLNKEHAARYKQLTERPDTIKLKDGSVLQHDPENPNADENGYVEIHPPMPTKPEKPDSPEQQAMDWAIAHGKNPMQAYQALHPHEWQQQPGGGAAAVQPPVSGDLQQQIAQLDPAVGERLSKLAPDTQQALLALARGDIPLSTWSARGTYKNIGGLTQAQAAGWATAITGKQFNAATFDNKKKLDQRYNNASTGEGAQLNAFNNFLLHAGDANDVIKQWDQQRVQTGVPWINTPINELRNKLLGDPLYSKLVAALAPVKKEYADFLNNHRAEHSQDIEEMQKILNDTETPAQLRDVLKQLGHTAILRLDSLNENYHNQTGIDYPNLVHPMAKNNPGLIDLGFGDSLARYRSGGTMPGVWRPGGVAPSAGGGAAAAPQGTPAGLVPF